MQEAFQHIVSFSASFPFPPASQFLLFTPLPAFLSYVHLVSISKLPPLCLSSNFLHFLRSLNFNIYTYLAFLQLLAFILLQYLNSPRCPSTTSCIHLVSYVAPPWPPRNFLQASCFNILKLSHTCASQQLPAFMQFQYLGFSPRLSATSCLHRHLGSISLRSYGLNTYTFTRPWPLHKLLTLMLFQYLRFLPGAPQQLPAFILFQYLNFLPGAPQQLAEFIWFRIWFPPLPLRIFLHASSF